MVMIASQPTVLTTANLDAEVPKLGPTPIGDFIRAHVRDLLALPGVQSVSFSKDAEVNVNSITPAYATAYGHLLEPAVMGVSILSKPWGKHPEPTPADVHWSNSPSHITRLGTALPGVWGYTFQPADPSPTLVLHTVTQADVARLDPLLRNQVTGNDQTWKLVLTKWVPNEPTPPKPRP